MLGRILLTLSALSQGISPFIADWNETHIYNPRWPPHAKFHNGQTMSMGILLCLVTLYYTWRIPITPSVNPKAKVEKKEQESETLESRMRKEMGKEMTRDSMVTAAIAGSLYWIAGLSAILYPGSRATDPEFGDGFPQAGIFPLFGGMAVAGAWLEVKGLRGA